MKLRKAIISDFQTCKNFFEDTDMKYNWLYFLYDEQEETKKENVLSIDSQTIKDLESAFKMDYEKYLSILSDHSSYMFVLENKKQSVGIFQISGRHGKFRINEWSMLPDISQKEVFKKVLKLRSPRIDNLTVTYFGTLAEDILLKLGFKQTGIRYFLRFEKVKEAK